MAGRRVGGHRDPVIGYALSVANRAMGVRLYGSPIEVVDETRRQATDLAAIVSDPGTQITVTEVVKSAPSLAFSGGPHSEAIVSLLEAIEASDTASAVAVLERNPTALRDSWNGAPVPLLAAASAWRSEIAGVLLQYGAAIDAVGEFDMTPLHWAAALGDLRTARLLLDAGADATRMTWFLVDAGELGAINGHAAVARLAGAGRGVEGFCLDVVIDRMKERSNALRGH